MDNRKQFIDLMEDAYNECSGLVIDKAVLFAQAAHESAWGGSGLFLKAYNLFGIKATSYWKGETIDLKGFEEVKGKNQYSVMKWRKYPSLAACIRNYNDIIRLNGFYQDALPYANKSSEEFLKNIIAEPASSKWPGGEPGWATDSKYFDKVKAVGKVIEELGGPKWQI